MISTDDKIRVLKLIVEDYCKYKLTIKDNKIIIDGGFINNYFIYDNLDEALIDLIENIMSLSDNIEYDENLKFAMDLIKPIRQCYKNKFMYSSKLNILNKFFNLYDIERLNFKFKNDEIIVSDKGSIRSYKNINDVLIKYQHDIRKKLYPEYKMVFNMILETSCSIIKEYIDKDYLLFRDSYFTLMIICKNNRRKIFKKSMLEVCKDVINYLDNNIALCERLSYNGYIQLNSNRMIMMYNKYIIEREYLLACYENISRMTNVYETKNIFISSQNGKLKLAKEIIEAIKDEYCFENIVWNEIDNRVYINIANLFINRKDDFNEFVEYLIDKEMDNDICSCEYLNSSYDAMKGIVENEINELLFFDDETEKYSYRKDINSILEKLNESRIPSYIIFANEDRIYISLNEDNSNYIVIEDNGTVIYKQDKSKFTDINELVCYVESIITEVKCNSSSEMANTLKDKNVNIESDNPISIKILSANKYTYFYKFNIQLEVNDNSSDINKLYTKHIVCCKIAYNNEIFNFDKFSFDIIESVGQTKKLKLNSNQINRIKEYITKYIIDNKLGNMSRYNKDVTILRDYKEITINKDNFEINDKYIKIDFKDIDEYIININKYELIEILLKDIDDKILLEELERRLKNK